MAGCLPVFFLTLVALILISWRAAATPIQGTVVDAAGGPVKDAVIAARPPQVPRAAPLQTAIIDQRGREFVPHVLAIRLGTHVHFPNSDNIQHHVYSFSPGNQFEIKLYKGNPTSPIQFMTPNVAVLGCNIHDWMVSYIYVADTPYFTLTDADGRWSLDLPADEYKITVWHADLDRRSETLTTTMRVTTQAMTGLSHRLSLRAVRRSGKPPTSLQEQTYSNEP